jgi:Protein of unknown function (DUF2911)
MFEIGRRHAAGALWVFCLLASTAALRAQASELPSTEAQAFVGDWSLAMDFQGNAFTMTLWLKDEGGKLAARLESPQSPQPMAITDIRREGDALHLQWSFDQGGQGMTLQMVLEPAGAGLAGTLSDTGGLFSADLSGTRVGAPAAGVGDASTPDGGSGGRLRRTGRESQLEVPDGKVRVTFDPIAAEGPDYERVAGLRDGEVLEWTRGRTIKLLSDSSLRFGDSVVPRGNVSPDYPGAYGIWLARAGDGWAFVFNGHADVWGTMHDPSADVAKVTAVHGTPSAPAMKLEVTLLPREGGGTLRVAWGAHEWSADFVVAP